jgi:hypothetical protein
MGDTDNTSAALALGQTKLPNLLVNPIGNFRLKKVDLNHDLLDSQSVYSGLGVERKILLFS